MASNSKPIIRKHAVTLVTLLAFIAMIFGVRWLVKTQRSPGAVTVIEAQGMDMTAMKAPPGVQPVAAEKAEFRRIGNEQAFPATVMAFSDEEIIARIPGRVVSLAYPGDHVRAGQIVAQLDAQEYFDQEKQARFTAEAGKGQTQVSSLEVDVLRASKARILADLGLAKVGVSKSEADKSVAEQELQRMLSEAEAKKALVRARQADLVYAEEDLGRQKQLYGEGIVSLDRYQLAQRSRDAAKATLQETASDAKAADQGAQAGSGRVASMEKEIDQARAEVKSAESAVLEADRSIDKARAQIGTSVTQAKASRSQAESASVIANYTKVRSLDNSMVSERYVAPGSVVAAGQKLLMLHMADKVRIQSQLPEKLAAWVISGTSVIVRHGNLVKSAQLTSVFPTADTNTRTFTVEAILSNPGHRLLPGSFATMTVQTDAAQLQLAVHSTAIQTDSSGNEFVWVVNQSAMGEKTDWTCPMHTEVSEPGPGKCPICKMDLVPRARSGKTVAVRKPVKSGAGDGVFTAITGDLHPNDEVIVAGFETLVEGSPVAVTPWGRDGPRQLPTVEVRPTDRPDSEMKAGKQASHKQLYTCPMHPGVVQNHPGKCPKCGMTLVPKKATG